jgi:hypothetical protein
MTEGYVYTLSNPEMRGILKIGMTDRTPEERVKELFTSGVPSPFKIEFAKKVKNPREKEAILHQLLENYHERVYSRREFFRVSLEEVRKLFELMDGDWWVDEEETADEDEEDEASSVETTVVVTGCRDMTKCFTHGQRIRHTYGVNKTWIGTYDSSKNGIVCDDILYGSLSKFALAHNRINNPTRKTTNGWSECECEVGGKWVSADSLRA